MANPSPVVKHHFWILFGSTPVLLGLALLLMLIFVSGSISAAKSEFDNAKSGLSKQPKSNGDMKVISRQVDVLEENRKELWGRSYEEQRKAGVFTWPESKEASFNALAKQDQTDPKMRFGESFLVQQRVTAPPVLKDTFDRAYTKVADGLAPTRFAGGNYLSALRTVTDWGTKPVETAPFWLALEDYWLQRGLLEPITRLNASAALFADVTPKGVDADPLKRTLRNRVWELDLEVATKGNKQLLQGQLRNLTPRLQPLGVNKAMKVQVWLRDLPADAQASDLPSPDIVFEIRGESVPGKGTLTCTPQEVNANTVTRISRVVQVFDEATVPVRLVNTLELGMLDHRNKATELVLPKHIETYEADNPPPAVAGPEGGAPPGTALGGRPGPGGPPPGMGEGPGAIGGPGAPGGTAAGRKFGTIDTVLLGNKKRYVKRTDDVRRMPVALSVIIDNDFLNDLLVEYTNSPLHFQVTQTQWARYKGVLPPVGGVGGATPPPGSEGPSFGEGGPPPGSALGSGGPGTAVGGPPMGPGFPGGSPGGPGGPGLPGGPGYPGGAATGGAGSLPGEASANLCEFALFGVVSLYEKVPPEEKKSADGTTGVNPMDAPGGMPPIPMGPTDPSKPSDPMGPKPDPNAPVPPTGPPGEEKKDPAAGKPGDEPKGNPLAPTPPNK